MTWADVLMVLFACLNLFGVVQNWRVRRRYLTLLSKVEATDHLLTVLCYEAFVRDHVPVWRAWSGPMGTYEVSVSVNRHHPGSERP